MFANLFQVIVERFFVFSVDDFKHLLQLVANFRYLSAGARIEENFAQQAVVFAQHTFGNCHVPFESCTRRVLMFHYRSKNKSAYEGNAERVGHGFIVLVKSVFTDVEA